MKLYNPDFFGIMVFFFKYFLILWQVFVAGAMLAYTPVYIYKKGIVICT